ncbi:poly-beta-1,6-N-acetyl-D-glucosamine biosynthesis protein PgaD [Dongia sp.]|uniref:poly-beta-1,6-N-acetyl-D-glucosamine biosynthesis protein PgaD n=1 Tax=Dongia sp. TaxID=1977262 RepID=UPI0037515F5A
MKRAWPPLITDAARPRWMLWRDRILTILVWILFLALFIQQWRLFQARVEAWLATPGAEWNFMLGPFFAVVGIMVAWLLLTAILTYSRAMRARRQAQPPPLSLEAEAAHFGVTPEALTAARQKQIIAVAIEPDGSFRFEDPTYTAAAVGKGQPGQPPPGR